MGASADKLDGLINQLALTRVWKPSPERMQSWHTQKGWVDTFLIFQVLSIMEPTFCSTILSSLSASTTPLPPTTLLSSTLKADAMNDPVVFNIAVSNIAIVLKPWMKC